MKKLIFLLLLASVYLAQAQPTIGGCKIFPANNIWNTPVDTLPLHAMSTTWINTIGAGLPLRHDNALGFNIVPGSQPMVHVLIVEGAAESDPGPYPIPPDPVIEAGRDSHILIIENQNCILYEIYSGARQADGSWRIYSAAKWDLGSNALRPDGWTSADAAGLPMTPGVLRYEEVESGEIRHAIRFTAPKTQRYNYLWPARHYASTDSSASLPKMGLRLRLKADFDISGYSPRMQVILRALKKYGLMLADNGLAWNMQLDNDPRWNEEELLTLRAATTGVFGRNLEAVDTSVLMSDPNSGRAGKVAMGIPVVFTDKVGRYVNEVATIGPGIAFVDGVLTATGGGGGAGGPVTSVAGRTGDVSLAISDIAGLTAALDSKMNARPYPPERPLSFTPPLSRAGDIISCPACNVTGGTTTPTGTATPPVQTGGSSAAFVKIDTTAMGNWPGVYGADGYMVVGGSSAVPSYVKVTPSGFSPWVWEGSTADVRGLYTAPSSSARAAAGWYSYSSFNVGLEFNDANTHQVARTRGQSLASWEGSTWCGT
jgi:hypothetical protein